MRAKIGFIGCGARASAYAMTLKRLDLLDVEYPAICNTNPDHLQRFNDDYCGGKAAMYADYRELLARHADLDGIVVATPNNQHEAPAIAAMRTGAQVLLEKPIATTPQACLNILRASRETGRWVTLGFVLRYTPFYRKIKELMGQVCGRMLTITAEEIVHRDVARFFAGGWRQTNEASGFLVLEKCCHDLDIFNWLTGKLPARVYSFGSTTHFIKKPGAGPRCSECALTEECAYFFDVETAREEAERSHEWRYLITYDDRCAYDGKYELCDHQIVGMEYDDGMLLTLTITVGNDLSTRTIRCLGTDGRVDGDLATGEIGIGLVKDLHNEREAISTDGSGHHGGDGAICREFAESILRGEAHRPTATIEDGFNSAMVAFAVERSRLEGRQVELAEIYAEMELPPVSAATAE